MGILLTDGKSDAPYVYQPYPKYVTHQDGRACVVPNIEAHRALGEGWPRPEGEAPSTSEPEATAIAEPKHAIAEKPAKRKARG